MQENLPRTSRDMASVVGGNSNSHPTTHKYSINCCIDYITVVFPYSIKNKYSFDTSYQEIYEDYKRHLPDISDIELFGLIENDYPGIQPGIHFRCTPSASPYMPSTARNIAAPGSCGGPVRRQK